MPAPLEIGYRTAATALALAVLWGCDQSTEPPPAMRVLRVVPATGPAQDRPGRLFLNSRITLFFNRDVDPLSVTSDTVRLTRVEAGSSVRVQFDRVVIGRRSVTLIPRVPLDAGLVDGTLRPNALYRIEVPGFPLTNTVSSSDGRGLKTGVAAWFRTVGRRPQDKDFATPFLPVGTGAEPFELRGRYKKLAHMAVGSGRLRLHFSLPPLPNSVTPRAFEVIRLRGSEMKTVAVRGVRVRSFPQPIDPHPGCAVELELDDPKDVQADDLLYVKLERENGLRDYRGRALHQETDQHFWVRMHRTPRVALLDLPQNQKGSEELVSLGFQPTKPGFLGFQATRGGIVAQANRQAGNGKLGLLHPRRDVTIEPGKAFDRGDGQMVSAGDTYDFQSIHVPAGVTLTLRSDRPLRFRCVGRILVAGTLVLDIQPPDGRLGALETLRLQDLPTCSPLTVIAGGDIRVEGRIVQKHPIGESRAALALVTSGTVYLPGAVSRVPMQTVLSADRLLGTVQAPLFCQMALQPGVATRQPIVAEAWTDWMALPEGHPLEVRVRALAARGVGIQAQFAPPHPLNKARPYLQGLGSPLVVHEAGTSAVVRRGSFVRFRLSARVVPDSPLPSVKRLLVETGVR